MYTLNFQTLDTSWTKFKIFVQNYESLYNKKHRNKNKLIYNKVL